MDALSVLALAKQCATTAPAIVVASIGLLETGGDPYAISASGHSVHDLAFSAAVQTLSADVASSEKPAVGMALISEQQLRDRGLTLKDGLSPCLNLRVAGELVRVEFEQLGGAAAGDWRKAAIAFGTGHPEAEKIDDYGARYDAARAQVENAERGLGERAAAINETAATSSASSWADDVAGRADAGGKPARSPISRNPDRRWDVFGRGHTARVRFPTQEQ